MAGFFIPSTWWSRPRIDKIHEMCEPSICGCAWALLLTRVCVLVNTRIGKTFVMLKRKKFQEKNIPILQKKERKKKEILILSVSNWVLFVFDYLPLTSMSNSSFVCWEPRRLWCSKLPVPTCRASLYLPTYPTSLLSNFVSEGAHRLRVRHVACIHARRKFRFPLAAALNHATHRSSRVHSSGKSQAQFNSRY